MKRLFIPKKFILLDKLYSQGARRGKRLLDSVIISDLYDCSYCTYTHNHTATLNWNVTKYTYAAPFANIVVFIELGAMHCDAVVPLSTVHLLLSLA